MEMRELEGYEEAIKKILKAIPVELRMADVPPEERLAGLAPEQTVRALPVEVLRGLSADFLATLPKEVRAEIERRLGRS